MLCTETRREFAARCSPTVGRDVGQAPATDAVMLGVGSGAQ
jgi:hypothetical protein